MSSSHASGVPVNPTLARAAATGWRVLVVAAVVVGAVWVVRRSFVLVLPLVVALLLARVLEPLARRLRNAGLSAGVAAAAVVAGGALVVAGVVAVVVPAVVEEFTDLGPTLDDAVDDVETWIVESGPFEVTRDELVDYREDALDRVGGFLESSGVVEGRASLLIEVPTGALLAVFLTFFAVKDGHRAVGAITDRLTGRRLRRVVATGRSAWEALGGYLRGAAILGVLEATVIGLAVWLTGGALVVPVMVLTFFAAFVPIVGAIVAGLVAVLVALVGGGVWAALVVGIVVLVVQQLDNDLLAPVIYGRSVRIHPAAILVSVVAGGVLLGPVGTILAVPTVAVAFNCWRADRAVLAEEAEGADEGGAGRDADGALGGGVP